ncbi:MAG TPA: DUF4430 domain-containing protein [Candidatus Saccharimonadales bacterium]|nr:DUF4430 domain-containing protein [Candidatus Saccharimonadales bacterium]
MASKHYASVALGITIVLAVIVATALTALRVDSHHAPQTAIRATGAMTVLCQGFNNTNALSLLEQHNAVRVTLTAPGSQAIVTAINGITADSRHYWAFYVNGLPAHVSPGAFITSDHDIITWKLQPK